MKKLKTFFAAAAMAICAVLVFGGCENQAKEDDDAPETEKPAAFGYTAGAYIGRGQGRNGALTVEMTFSESRILSAQMSLHAESIENAVYGGAARVREALDAIPRAIVEKQGTAGVDAVTGATLTSAGILAAAADCINQAAAPQPAAP